VLKRGQSFHMWRGLSKEGRKNAETLEKIGKTVGARNGIYARTGKQGVSERGGDCQNQHRGSGRRVKWGAEKTRRRESSEKLGPPLRRQVTFLRKRRTKL